MSYYVAVDGELGPQVATNSGWHDFCESVRRRKNLGELHRFADDGRSVDAPLLRAELARLLASGAPTEDDRIIGEGLLGTLAAVPAGVEVVITDGSMD